MQVAKKLIVDSLSHSYDKNEIRSISRLIFEKITGFSGIQVHLNMNETISAANLAQIEEILSRLTKFEPIQYILGETEFYGSKIKVNPNVLIPRPETEELVEWIINDHKGSGPSILDIGTGSGCIPVALLKNLPGASADGWDISKEALKVAKENSVINQVTINFQYADINLSFKQ
jgi:release factor glutamine methyltransferase